MADDKKPKKTTYQETLDDTLPIAAHPMVARAPLSQAEVKEIYGMKYRGLVGKKPKAAAPEVKIITPEVKPPDVKPQVSPLDVKREERESALAAGVLRREAKELSQIEAREKLLKGRIHLLPLGSAEGRKLRAQIRALEGSAKAQRAEVKLARVSAAGQRTQAKLVRGLARESKARARAGRFQAKIVREQLKRERLKTRAARRAVRVRGHKRGTPKRRRRPRKQEFAFTFAGGGQARRRRVRKRG